MSFLTAYYDAGFGRRKTIKENDVIHIDSHWGDPDAGNSGYGEYNYGDNEDTASGVSFKTCRYCGQTDLEWLKTPNGWRLGSYITGLHKCKNRSLPESKKVQSSKVYDLLSNAIEGNHLSEKEGKEYDQLQKYFKDNGLTVDDLLKKT